MIVQHDKKLVHRMNRIYRKIMMIMSGFWLNIKVGRTNITRANGLYMLQTVSTFLSYYMGQRNKKGQQNFI